jgi:Cu(I)/Ag(I) efflux system membrane fusion protein
MILGFGLGYWLRGGETTGQNTARSQVPTEHPGGAEERMVYVCPMMCVPPMEKPGKCPICGMDLMSVSSGVEAQEMDRARFKMTPEAVRLAGIQLAPVERRFVSAQIRLFGQIEYDPVHMSYIAASMPGLINRVYVKRAGQFVRWGDPLFDLYSSDLLETQRQLADAMKYVPGFFNFQGGSAYVGRDTPVMARRAVEDPANRSPEVENALKTIEGLRHKLSILGLPKRDIDEFMKLGESTGIATVYAPMYGQVVEQNAFEGSYVNRGTAIITIADPLYVWVGLNAYETDYAWIRKDQEVTFETDAYPGESFKSKVAFVDPVFNPKTRTFKVGALFSEDRGGRLKTGMLVRAVVHAELTAEGKVSSGRAREQQAPLLIPASAPLITGKRAVAYVAVKDEDGVFEGREIVLGPKAENSYVVLGGLEEGERVVVNGNFKIDSAIQILAGSSMMGIEGGHSAVAHHHHGGSELMHEDYWSERTENRSASTLEPKNLEPGASRQMEQGRERRPETRGRGSSAVIRKRPGMYGDAVRPATPLQNQ